MEAIDTLRREARSKRDRAIQAARSEYRRSMVQIDQLSLSLGADRPRKSKAKGQPIMDMIRELLPQDRTFTVSDMVAMMRQREPGRDFNVPTIRTYFPRLTELGTIRKVSRDNKGHVLWAAAGLKAEAGPFGAMPLTEVAEFVLKLCGPMELVALVIEMQQRGFRPKGDPRQIMRSLRWADKRYPGRFKRDGEGRWLSRVSEPSLCNAK